jgi:hypothetical protein
VIPTDVGIVPKQPPPPNSHKQTKQIRAFTAKERHEFTQKCFNGRTVTSRNKIDLILPVGMPLA